MAVKIITNDVEVRIYNEYFVTFWKAWIVIFEIEVIEKRQSSDTTYRLYDYDRIDQKTRFLS